MATPESNKLEIDALKLTLDLLLSKSKQPKDGEASTTVNVAALIPIQNPGENVKFINSETFLFLILKTMGMVDVSKTSDLSGVVVFGKVAGINTGGFFIGVSSAPTPTTNAHISEFYLQM